MHLQWFISVINRWLGRERVLVPCVARKVNPAKYLLLIALLAGAETASASVLTQGSVTPSDNPFTTGFNEGLPSDGNFLNPFAVDPTTGLPLKNNQQNWEGITLNGVSNIVTDGTYNVTVGTITYSVPVSIQEIVVGKSSAGSLVVSGESVLNDQMLTIGGSAPRGTTGTFQAGAGYMSITGAGSVFNNDPGIIPQVFIDNPSLGIDKSNISVNARPPDGADGNGNDLVIGRIGTIAAAGGPTDPGGSGTLAISNGGRAEIQDAVILGRDPGSTGTLTVDGAGSFLGSGGFKNTGSDHIMVIGRQGTGTMSITNQAVVQTIAPGIVADPGTADFAATIGDLPYIAGTASTIPGGNGTVTVDGASPSGTGSTNLGAQWNLSGSLQVGGFVDNPGTSPGNFTDLTGVNSLYTTRQGQGALNVKNGAVVNVNLNPGVNPNTNSLLFLAVGYLGSINMSGGTINIGANNVQGSTSRLDRTQLINDGVITGTGTINTSVFRNRYTGRVIVNPGQTLAISSTSFYPTSPSTNDFYPLTNYGLIEVTGTQDARATLDFQRPKGDSNTGAIPGGNPLINSIVVPTGSTNSQDRFSGGIISAQWATIRSGSGILNQGVVAFTGGSNIVQADFQNSTGAVLSIGPNASVVVEDDCKGCTPFWVGTGNTLLILDGGTYTSAGVMTTQLSLANPNSISAVGDIGISGTIKVTSLASDVIADFKAIGPSDTYSVISFGGQAYQTKLDSNNVAQVDTAKVIPDCTGVSFCSVPGLGVTFPSLNLATLLGPAFNGFVPVAQRIGEQIVIGFINPGLTGASGPDFNGDGVVNSLDLAIWQQNVGITAGATVLQGDANGDGRVDGQDFLIWQSHLGPYPGAGSGSSFAVIPEPTSIALVLMSGLAWLPLRRRSAG